jgi:16S rRNA (uracil1498-N3)-methyltransferase
LDATEARHATSVLRLRVDDEVGLFDGQGRGALGKVIEAKRDVLGVEVHTWQEPVPDSASELILAIALPKGDRQKTVVDAATELGVTRFVPILCERGVAQPTDNALERLRRQVVEACKQCGRNRLMEISEPATLAQLNSQAADSLKLIAHPYDVGRPRELLASYLLDDKQSVVLAIGPEGGFTDQEVIELSADGWKVIDLGPLILRIEIAAIAAVAQVMGWLRTKSAGHIVRDRTTST